MPAVIFMTSFAINTPTVLQVRGAECQKHIDVPCDDICTRIYITRRITNSKILQEKGNEENIRDNQCIVGLTDTNTYATTIFYTIIAQMKASDPAHGLSVQ